MPAGRVMKSFVDIEQREPYRSIIRVIMSYGYHHAITQREIRWELNGKIPGSSSKHISQTLYNALRELREMGILEVHGRKQNQYQYILSEDYEWWGLLKEATLLIERARSSTTLKKEDAT